MAKVNDSLTLDLGAAAVGFTKTKAGNGDKEPAYAIRKTNLKTICAALLTVAVVAAVALAAMGKGLALTKRQSHEARVGEHSNALKLTQLGMRLETELYEDEEELQRFKAVERSEEENERFMHMRLRTIFNTGLHDVERNLRKTAVSLEVDDETTELLVTTVAKRYRKIWYTAFKTIDEFSNSSSKLLMSHEKTLKGARSAADRTLKRVHGEVHDVAMREIKNIKDKGDVKELPEEVQANNQVARVFRSVHQFEELFAVNIPKPVVSKMDQILARLTDASDEGMDRDEAHRELQTLLLAEPKQFAAYQAAVKRAGSDKAARKAIRKPKLKFGLQSHDIDLTLLSNKDDIISKLQRFIRAVKKAQHFKHVGVRELKGLEHRWKTHEIPAAWLLYMLHERVTGPQASHYPTWFQKLVNDLTGEDVTIPEGFLRPEQSASSVGGRSSKGKPSLADALAGPSKVKTRSPAGAQGGAGKKTKGANTASGTPPAPGKASSNAVEKVFKKQNKRSLQ